jgi:hypothetical protein
MSRFKTILASVAAVIAILCAAPPQVRAQTHVQWASNNACTYEATCSFSFGSNTTAGNLIVACGGFNNGTNAPTFSDSQGDTFSSAIARFNNSSAALVCYYAANIHGGADTVTCSISGSGYCIPAAEEIAGAAASSPLDQTGTATPSSASPSATTSGAIAQGNEIVIGSGMDWTGARSWTAGTGFNNSVSIRNSSCGCSAAMESMTLTGGSGTQTATFSIGVTDPTAIAVMTFKGASSGGACSPSLALLHAGRCD